MKKIKVYLEIGTDGTFNAYMPSNLLPFGAIGEGNTAEEARQDFLNVVNGMALEYPGALEGVDFQFLFDTRSLLDYYRHIFTLEGLRRVTGIAAGQLSHYLNGYRTPSARTAAKIQNSLREFGTELSKTTLL